MFFFDNKEHKLPHIHVEYQSKTAVIGIPEGDLIARKFPKDKLKLVQAWVEIHKDELMANWKLAIEGQSVYKIEALK